MSKFFVNSNQIKDNKAILVGENANHIKNVLRMKEDDELSISDENGKTYICNIQEIEQDKVACNVLKEDLNNVETICSLEIFQGLPKADKLEHIIQKCTELGVKEITPVAMKRCVVKLDKKSEVAKVRRWQKIAESASKQSNRNAVAKINNPISMQNLVDKAKEYDILIVPYEKETKTKLKTVLQNFTKKTNKIGVVIGPEGGFEEQEIKALEEAGGKIVTLGSRILRTETVATVIASIVLYELDEM